MSLQSGKNLLHDSVADQEFAITIRQEFVDCAVLHNLVGMIIDTGDIDGSGGGYYPMMMRDGFGKFIQVSSHIGDLAYNLKEIETECLIDMTVLKSFKIFETAFKEIEYKDASGDKAWHYALGLALLGSAWETFFHCENAHEIKLHVYDITWNTDALITELPSELVTTIDVFEGCDVADLITTKLFDMYSYPVISFKTKEL